MRIGNLTLPNNPHRLPTLLVALAKICAAYPKAIIPDAHKDDHLAKLLGYASSHNGAYWNRLSAMKYYKLTEGRPDIRLTELAKKIMTPPNEVERVAAYFEAVCSIVLWRELYKRHKFNLPRQNLWKDIAEITDCTPEKARSVESFVQEAFEVDTNSIRTYNFEPPTGTLHVEVGQGNTQMQARVQGDVQIEIKVGPYYHQLPFTSDGLREAIEILKRIKAP